MNLGKGERRSQAKKEEKSLRVGRLLIPDIGTRPGPMEIRSYKDRKGLQGVFLTMVYFLPSYIKIFKH